MFVTSRDVKGHGWDGPGKLHSPSASRIRKVPAPFHAVPCCCRLFLCYASSSSALSGLVSCARMLQAGFEHPECLGGIQLQLL